VLPPTGALPSDDSGMVAPASHQTHCAFDAYGHYDEIRSRAKQPKKRQWRRSRCRHGCPDCGPDAPCDFECANCYSRWDIEKRLFVTYSHANALGAQTVETYGDSDGAQVGIELLPFIISDNQHYYSRFGLMAMFNYVNYEGSPDVTLQSRLSGNLLTIDDADTFGLAIGPVYRIDFEIAGIRLSPNAAVGLALDWTNVDEILPQGTITRSVDRFKFTAFDAGAYIRMALDVGITETLNVSIGGDYKLVKTDAMIDNDFRNHFGVVVGFSHEF
jgi:hypothetical protein